jgi:Arc/MetJ family transcription regulator
MIKRNKNKKLIVVSNNDLAEKAIYLTGLKSKRQVVQLALERFVQQGATVRVLLKLKGKARWEGELNRMRKNRM